MPYSASLATTFKAAQKTDEMIETDSPVNRINGSGPIFLSF
jgi:hypothetical protein